jgi:hypothetical protein
LAGRLSHRGCPWINQRSSGVAGDPAIKVTLTLESSLGEIIAVLTVGTLMGLAGSQSLVEGLTTGFGHHVMIDVAVGIAVGFAWSSGRK